MLMSWRLIYFSSYAGWHLLKQSPHLIEEDDDFCTHRSHVKIRQTVLFGIPSSSSSQRQSCLTARGTRSTLSDDVPAEGRPERGSLSTDVRPLLNRLYLFLGSFICVMQIHSSLKVFCNILIVSAQHLPRLKQNMPFLQNGVVNKHTLRRS